MSLAKADVEERPAAPQQEPDRCGDDEPEGEPLHSQLPDYQVTRLRDYSPATEGSVLLRAARVGQSTESPDLVFGQPHVRR
jgi:hypothetical protein